MKIRKATDDEVRQLADFMRTIEDYLDHGTHTGDEPDAETERIDADRFVDILREKWGGRFNPPRVDCGWTPVVFGYDTLVRNLCDPDADTLELLPDIAAAIESGGAVPYKPVEFPLSDERIVQATLCDEEDEVRIHLVGKFAGELLVIPSAGNSVRLRAYPRRRRDAQDND